jgi:phage shock protein A
MTIEEQLLRLTGIVESLVGSVLPFANQIEAHDKQIGALIQAAEQQKRRMDELQETIAAMERRWQAYLNTLPRQ